MNATEKHALLEKTVERIGRMANLSSRQCDYFVKLVHNAADIENVEAVFQRLNERDNEAALNHFAEIMYGVLFKFAAILQIRGDAGGPLFMVLVRVFRRFAVKKLVAIEATAVYCSRLGPKWKLRFIQVSLNSS